MGPTIPEREAYMLSRRHCPHTGIVNFFADADPFMAIGSVIKAGEPALYHWRCYMGHLPAVGVASDMRTAEIHFFSHYRELLRAASLDGETIGAAPGFAGEADGASEPRSSPRVRVKMPRVRAIP
jgi:hypothetical protein